MYIYIQYIYVYVDQISSRFTIRGPPVKHWLGTTHELAPAYCLGP